MEITKGNSIWDKLFNGELEHNRFAIISGVLLIVGCMGGIATFYGAMSSTSQLILILVPTMATLASLLAVAPVKRILTFATIAVLLDVIIILYNALN